MALENQGVQYKISLEDYFSKGLMEAESHAQGFERAVSGIGGQLKELAITAAGAFGVFAGFEFFKSASEGFLDSEKTAKQLQFAVGKRGGLASDFQDLVEQSEKLQRTGIFNHAEMQKTAANLLNAGVGVRSVRSSLSTFADVAAQKNMSPEEVAMLIERSSSMGMSRGLYQFFGDKSPILEKAESVDDLGNHIKNAGAEARNFTKIMAALKEEFQGGMADILTTDFGKIENVKQRFELFKESVGKSLVDSFVQFIPEIQKVIVHLTELFKWIKENANLLIGLGKAALLTFGIFKGAQLAAAGFKAIKFALMDLNAWFQIVTTSETTLSEAMLITPWGAIAAGIGLIAAAWMGVQGAADDAAEAQKQANKNAEDANRGYEREHIENLIDDYIKLHHVKEEVARQKVLETELERLDPNSATNKNAPVFTTADEDERKRAARAYQDAFLKEVQQQLDELKRQKLRSGANDSALGSELSEPTASKIQNVTITMGDLFPNMKNTFSSMEMGIDDFVSKLSNALNTVVEDAATVATE